MKISCGKHAGKVLKKCSCKEIREAFYGFISGAILFMNLRVLKTADATVAIAIREANKMADEKTSCQCRCFFRPNHWIFFFLYLTKTQIERELGLRISLNNLFR